MSFLFLSKKKKICISTSSLHKRNQNAFSSAFPMEFLFTLKFLINFFNKNILFAGIPCISQKLAVIIFISYFLRWFCFIYISTSIFNSFNICLFIAILYLVLKYSLYIFDISLDVPLSYISPFLCCSYSFNCLYDRLSFIYKPVLKI